MRSKSIILLALALGCGLVASIGISQVMDARNKTPAPTGATQPVFVAMVDINPNEELTAQNVKLEEWPTNIVPQAALNKLEDVEHKRVRVKLYAGEPVLASKLVGPADAVGAAKEIPPGYRVAHVKVDPVTGSSNLILPGDRVDVLVFRNPSHDQNATAAKIVLQDIKVFAVDTQTETQFSATKGEQTEPITAKTIALLVTPQQSVILHAATELGGAVRLILRNPEDDTHVTSDGATLGDIFGSRETSNREAEQQSRQERSKDDSEITQWLTQQSNQPKQSAVPTPPPAPVVEPAAPKRKMLVMMGPELIQVELPGKGELPINQPKSEGGTGPYSLGGQNGASSPAPPPTAIPPQSPAEGHEPAAPEGNSDDAT